MTQRLRTFYRRLLNRCVLCGDKRSRRSDTDIMTWGPYCRACNKGLAFAGFYSMGPAKLKEYLETREHQQAGPAVSRYRPW